MADKQTILVTGATGFIGGRLVETLYLNRFANVRAGIRSWSSPARIARFPIEMVLCDVMDPTQLTQAMKGATAVVHCASFDSKDIIVQGTKNMLEVALKAGIKRFVYLSTAEVYGNVRGEIDETSPYQYTSSVYADSKIEAEELCWAFYRKGVPVTIARPSIVYGPFSNSWTTGFANRLQSGNWSTFENYGEGICNLVYVDDLIAAVILMMKHENAVGEAFNINGPEKITWNHYFRRFNDALGLPPLNQLSSGRSRLRTTMTEGARLFTGFFLDRFGDVLMDIYLRGGMPSKMMKRVKSSLNSTPSIKELEDLYSRNAYYVPTKAEQMLDYKPKFNLDTGLRISILWLDHHGYLHQSPSWLYETTHGQPLGMTGERSQIGI